MRHCCFFFTFEKLFYKNCKFQHHQTLTEWSLNIPKCTFSEPSLSQMLDVLNTQFVQCLDLCAIVVMFHSLKHYIWSAFHTGFYLCTPFKIHERDRTGGSTLYTWYKLRQGGISYFFYSGSKLVYRQAMWYSLMCKYFISFTWVVFKFTFVLL